MADTRSQLALRELRSHFLAPRTLAVLSIIAILLTAAAPFNSGAAVGLGMLAVFWFGVTFGSYAIGLVTAVMLLPLLTSWPKPLRIAGLAIATGVTTGLPIELFTNAVFYMPETFAAWLQSLGQKFWIGVCVSLGLQISGATERPGKPEALEASAPPPLLDRLPLDKRGALVALSVEDHYVRVRTSRGEEMLLMRLTDAIREASPTPGLRVHRSHWVAKGAVTAATRKGDRAILSLSHGDDIPVSRSHIPALKDAGLLPR